MARPYRIAGLFLLVVLTTGLWSFFANASSAQKPVKVIFGVSRPPFISSTPPSGLAWELAGEAFKRMQINIKPSFSPNKRMEMALTQGTADIAVEVQPTDPRLFYSVPFIAYRNFVVTRKQDGISFKNWEDLAGFNVCAWQGATFNLGKGFEKATHHFGAYQEFPHQEIQVHRWLLGSFDAIVIDDTLLNWWTRNIMETVPQEKQDQIDLDFTFAPVPGENELWWYVGFRDQVLRNNFNYHLNAMKEDGTYERIREQFQLDK